MRLLEDKEAVLAKVHGMLKPGGLFISSTACIGDMRMFFKLIAPIGGFFKGSAVGQRLYREGAARQLDRHRF